MRGKKIAIRSTQGQNKVVRSTQGGVTLIHLLQNIFDVDMTDISLSENHINSLVICNLIYMLCFWLAVHGKPVLFWKGISGLKFPCFLLYAYEGDGNHSSHGRFRYYYVNYRTFPRRK